MKDTSITYKGKVYKSTRALAKSFNVPVSRIIKAIRNNKLDELDLATQSDEMHKLKECTDALATILFSFDPNLALRMRWSMPKSIDTYNITIHAWDGITAWEISKRLSELLDIPRCNIEDHIYKLRISELTMDKIEQIITLRKMIGK